MQKLREEEEEEVQVLLLSTLSSCLQLDTASALASDGVSLLGHKLSHPSLSVRREAAAAMMALRLVTRLDDITSAPPQVVSVRTVGSLHHSGPLVSLFVLCWFQRL